MLPHPTGRKKIGSSINAQSIVRRFLVLFLLSSEENGFNVCMRPDRPMKPKRNGCLQPPGIQKPLEQRSSGALPMMMAGLSINDAIFYLHEETLHSAHLVLKNIKEQLQPLGVLFQTQILS